MPPQRHRYTRCVLFTGQRANKSNEQVVCKYCSEGESPQWALQHALLCNTKKLVKNHLRRCRFFQLAQQNGTEDPIVFTEDEESDGEHRVNNSNKRKTYVRVGGNADADTSTPTNINTEGKRARVENAAAEAATSRCDSSFSTPSTVVKRGQGRRSVTPITLFDAEVFGRLALDATLLNGWQFSWVETLASAKMLQYLSPNISLPSQEALRDRVLVSAAKKAASDVSAAISREKLGCTLVLDSIDHLIHEKKLGMVMTTSTGESFVWNVKENTNGRELAPVTDAVIFTLNALAVESVPLVGVVADSNRVYANVRRSLRRTRRDLMVLPCLAHQLNALAADVLVLAPTWRDAVVKAVEIMAVVHATPTLRAILMENKNKKTPAHQKERVCSWQSVCAVISDALEVKTLMQGQQEPIDVISSQLVSEEPVAQSLMDARHVLSSIAAWIDILTSQQARLCHVPVMYQTIASALERVTDPDTRSLLHNRLEDRWNEWEHPLLILAVVLNPAFGWQAIDTSSSVTLMRLGCWARYYYESFFGSQPTELSNELLEYIEGDKFWCSATSIAAFRTPTEQNHPVLGADVLAKLSFKAVAYWKSCSSECPELSKLALRVFAVVLTSASTDNLFDPVPALDKGSLSDDLRIAALRVRAKARFEQRLRVKSRDTAPHASTSIDHATFDALLQHWAKHGVDDFDQDVQRHTTKETEAINAMYAHIHPADDKFSKYPVLSLFKNDESTSPQATETQCT